MQIWRDYRCTAKVKLASAVTAPTAAASNYTAKTFNQTKPSGVTKTKTFKPIPAGSLKLFPQTAPEESEQSSEQWEVKSVSGWH